MYIAHVQNQTISNNKYVRMWIWYDAYIDNTYVDISYIHHALVKRPFYVDGLLCGEMYVCVQWFLPRIIKQS